MVVPMIILMLVVCDWRRDIPEIVSSADMLKYSFEEYARANFNMMKRKSAISLRRQKSFSTQQICAYSKVCAILSVYLHQQQRQQHFCALFSPVVVFGC
jgi:hypothetical protein